MSKRSREEASAANGHSVVPDSKKRKRQRNERPTVVDQTPPAAPVAVGDDTGLSYAEPEARKRAKTEKERKLRKAAKDASKLARLAEKVCKTEPGTMDPELHTNATTQRVDETAISKQERKAMKKSRKEAKAAKRAAKDETRAARRGHDNKGSLTFTADADEVGESDTAPSTALDATADSSVPSKVPSSVTSPEPDMIGSASRNYAQAEALKALPQSEIDDFLNDNGIDITDPTSTSLQYRPITSFSHLSVTDPALRTPFASFISPTPIQATAWPFALAGRDVVGVAETGSGKTLAFGLPCVQYISSLTKGERKGIKAVMVSPTRELAVQINEQLVKLAEPAGLKTACVYGGVPKDEQRLALKKAHIVIATPGRLTDLIDEGAAKLSSVGYLVLDEADRMLDKGFEDAIREIINGLPPSPSRQTLMFTATWPQSVRELASTFMTTPVKISIGDNHTGELRANIRISQTVEVVDPHNKQFRLLQLLKDHIGHGKTKKGTGGDTKILVFCLYKKEATRIEGFIRSKGFRVAGIHGDLSQAQRITSLDAFKQGKVPILVATDVAARGLDIPDVSLVINVTFPLTAEDYVHRIGRTGRAGKEGKAVTLFTDHDKALAGALINVLKAANQPVPEDLLKFGTTVKKKAHDAYGAFYKDTGGMKQATKITFD